MELFEALACSPRAARRWAAAAALGTGSRWTHSCGHPGRSWRPLAGHRGTGRPTSTLWRFFFNMASVLLSICVEVDGGRRTWGHLSSQAEPDKNYFMKNILHCRKDSSTTWIYRRRRRRLRHGELMSCWQTVTRSCFVRIYSGFEKNNTIIYFTHRKRKFGVRFVSIYICSSKKDDLCSIIGIKGKKGILIWRKLKSVR